MLKKLFTYSLLGLSALMVGVAIYDHTIITNVASQLASKFQTAVPALLQGMIENPVATVAGAAATIAPFIMIAKYVYDIKKKAAEVTQQATQSMSESSKVAYNAMSEVDTLKTEYSGKLEEYQTMVKTGQDLVAEAQLKAVRLEKENETLRTELSVAQNKIKEWEEKFIIPTDRPT
jgi:hypothetical protein